MARTGALLTLAIVVGLRQELLFLPIDRLVECTLFTILALQGAGRLAIWHTTKRDVRPLAVGNLPDLPAATPYPAHLGESTPLNQVGVCGQYSG